MSPSPEQRGSAAKGCTVCLTVCGECRAPVVSVRCANLGCTGRLRVCRCQLAVEAYRSAGGQCTHCLLAGDAPAGT